MRYRPIALWNDTAIFITFDEGGGYYDSGYVQPLDFFGDGTRIPLIVVSPYTQGGISPTTIQTTFPSSSSSRQTGADPVTKRSRDNIPIQLLRPDNPYVPTNSPAIDDLFDLFNFNQNGSGGNGNGNQWSNGNGNAVEMDGADARADASF